MGFFFVFGCVWVEAAWPKLRHISFHWNDCVRFKTCDVLKFLGFHIFHAFLYHIQFTSVFFHCFDVHRQSVYLAHLLVTFPWKKSDTMKFQYIVMNEHWELVFSMKFCENFLWMITYKIQWAKIFFTRSHRQFLYLYTWEDKWSRAVCWMDFMKIRSYVITNK